MHLIRSKRKVIARISAWALAAFVGALTTGTALAQTQPLKAEEAFKNIQALKGISAADFMGTMGIMTTALGFDCES